ncbi:hypothetical protein KP509_1Z080200 [Ceratopteris richardii]|nr:hypothetical protein KP509_1Z080200 [Ceratopteris richardii]
MSCLFYVDQVDHFSKLKPKVHKMVPYWGSKCFTWSCFSIFIGFPSSPFPPLPAALSLPPFPPLFFFFFLPFLSTSLLSFPPHSSLIPFLSLLQKWFLLGVLNALHRAASLSLLVFHIYIYISPPPPPPPPPPPSSPPFFSPFLPFSTPSLPIRLSFPFLSL